VGFGEGGGIRSVQLSERKRGMLLPKRHQIKHLDFVLPSFGTRPSEAKILSLMTAVRSCARVSAAGTRMARRKDSSSTFSGGIVVPNSLVATSACTKPCLRCRSYSGSFISCQYPRNSANVPWANRRNRAWSSSSFVVISKIAYCDGPRCSGVRKWVRKWLIATGTSG